MNALLASPRGLQRPVSFYSTPRGAFGPASPVFEGSAEIVTCLAQIRDKAEARRR